MLVAIFIQLYVIAVGALIFAGAKLLYARKHYRYRPHVPSVPESELPSVTVCLPARNETNAMTACLESALASRYPKLEIIVLDDNSNDNTSHLIKAFAHAGVRFIKGGALPEDWLGKNFALETLRGDASGRYMLFMDVDTQVSPQSIRRTVEHALDSSAAMVSVIPQRYDTYRPSAWFGTLRYFWEMVLANRSRPGTSSAAWLIDRRVLSDELGGFGMWRDEVQPELHIARELAKTNDHSLLVSTPELGVRYEKKWSSQIETGRRLLLPRFRNSTPNVLVGIGLLCSVLLPQLIIVMSIIDRSWTILIVEVIPGLLAAAVFLLYCQLAWSSRWWMGVFAAPFVAWQEMGLMISSAIGYKMGTITWKGRVVTRPTRKRSSA